MWAALASVRSIFCVLCSILLVCLSACGGAHHGTSATRMTPLGQAVGDIRLPAGVAARVGGNSIAKQTLEHWIGVQAVVQYRPRPARPVPRGVIPKPPRYRDCIAYLAAIARAMQTRPEPDTAQLAHQCAQKHETLRRSMLEMLINHFWVKEEAAKAGVRVTAREINQVLRRQFPTEAELHRFLAFTGVHASDERFLLGNVLLLAKWQRASLPVYDRLRRSKPPESAQMAEEVDVELGKLSESMKRTWTPRTHCGASYVIALCSEYKG
jgi:hypothetical protein